MTRTCRDCPADISHRGSRALRCETCAPLAKNAATQAHHARVRPTFARNGRTCTDCPADISHRGNRALRCEACSSTAWRSSATEANRRYRTRNPGQGTAYSRVWRAANPERSRANYRRQNHTPARREYLARYYRDNAETRRQYDRAWRAANPEACRAFRVRQRENRRMAQHARRARMRSQPWEVIRYEDVAARDEGECQLCHEPVDPDLEHPDMMSGSVDHVIPIAAGGPHTMANVALSHLGCNLRKGSRV